MNFRYKHLSPIYAGQATSETSTLNASYFKELLFGNYDFGSLLPFTQRIPVLGFFSELSFLEEPAFKTKHLTFIQEIKEKIHKETNNPASLRENLNYFNILTRYGICDLPKFKITESFGPAPDLLLDLELLKAGAKANFAVSNDQPVACSNFAIIAKKTLDGNNVSDRMKLLTGNRLVVASYRFSRDQDSRAKAREIASQLLTILDNLPDDFLNQLYKSIVFRGIAMISEWGKPRQDELLDSAYEIALNLKPISSLDTIVAKENLYTLLQTLSKWHARDGNIKQAELDLHEMIRLDPYDSTAYSELGLFLSEQDHFDEAAVYFKKAVDLGPPSVGMNLYFHVKCLEKSGKPFNNTELLEEVISADPDSISAFLDLIDYYEQAHLLTELNKMIQHVLSTESLYSQLEDNEKEKLQLLCK